MRLLLIIFVALLCIAIREITLLPDGELHVYILDVGQGDASLIVTPSGKRILVDGGPDQSILEHLPRYVSFFDRTLDLVVLTHPDADHVNGLAAVLLRYEIVNIMLTGVEHSLGQYQSLVSTALHQEIPIIRPDPLIDILFSDGTILDVLWPNSSEAVGKLNNTSIVFRVLGRKRVALLTGDIEKSAEIAILASGADIRAETLKVPHHGSRTSSTEAFLRAVSPKKAVISAGADNRYGHPHHDVLERYRSLGIPISRPSS